MTSMRPRNNTSTMGASGSSTASNGQQFNLNMSNQTMASPPPSSGMPSDGSLHHDNNGNEYVFDLNIDRGFGGGGGQGGNGGGSGGAGGGQPPPVPPGPVPVQSQYQPNFNSGPVNFGINAPDVSGELPTLTPEMIATLERRGIMAAQAAGRNAQAGLVSRGGNIDSAYFAGQNARIQQGVGSSAAQVMSDVALRKAMLDRDNEMSRRGMMLDKYGMDIGRRAQEYGIGLDRGRFDFDQYRFGEGLRRDDRDFEDRGQRDDRDFEQRQKEFEREMEIREKELQARIDELGENDDLERAMLEEELRRLRAINNANNA